MKAGRPRAFDPEAALEAALQVFWRKGYEGATLPDLTAAMGINRPSLYATFGSKEALFRRALDRYAERRAEYVRQALAEPTARAAVEHFLRGAAGLQTDAANPPGCLAVVGALVGAEAADSVRKELCERRAAVELALRERFEQAQTAGDLPADANCADLARFIATVVQGMSVQAAGGASRADLERVVDLTLRAWPT
ncbi:MAG TPA: TetR/AcrR family transcriptional regulator [Pirellulaceae bacterium]|nr:TetR/AcrR family transcriptional regulator [Pirellulaceae bacterium]